MVFIKVTFIWSQKLCTSPTTLLISSNCFYRYLFLGPFSILWDPTTNIYLANQWRWKDAGTSSSFFNTCPNPPCRGSKPSTGGLCSSCRKQSRNTMGTSTRRASMQVARQHPEELMSCQGLGRLWDNLDQLCCLKPISFPLWPRFPHSYSRLLRAAENLREIRL